MSYLHPYQAFFNSKAKAELFFLAQEPRLETMFSCSNYDSECNLSLKKDELKVTYLNKSPEIVSEFNIITVLDDLLFNQNLITSSYNSLIYLGASWPNFYSYQLMKQLAPHTPHSIIGIRDLNPEYHAENFKDYQLHFISDRQLFLFEYDLKDQLSLLSDSVSLCIHLNFFNQSVFPGASPQFPGGPLWWQAMILLKQLFKLKKIEQVILVGIPKENPKSQEFQGALALLLKKLLCYEVLNRTAVI